MADPYFLSFEAFAVGGGTPPVAIASGTRRYSPADVRTSKHTAYDGAIFWEKSLSLNAGFGVGLVMASTADQDAVTLFVARESDPRGFSFEVFAEQGGIFVHPEQGELKVSFLPAPSPDHIEGIEFLTDVTLRYIDDLKKDADFTHQIVVQQGSLFRVR